MNNAITYSNGISTVKITFGEEHAKTCQVCVNGKTQTMTVRQAEDFSRALEEAEYVVI